MMQDVNMLPGCSERHLYRSEGQSISKSHTSYLRQMNTEMERSSYLPIQAIYPLERGDEA